MGFGLTREQHRFSEEVAQTLSLLTVTRPQLIEKIVSHVVQGIPATALAGNPNCAQIYRGKKQFLRLRETVAMLTESYSRLFASTSDTDDAKAFPIILISDKDELARGYIWKSVRNGSVYRTADLRFFTLSED